jgi:hypothetical protein
VVGTVVAEKVAVRAAAETVAVGMVVAAAEAETWDSATLAMGTAVVEKVGEGTVAASEVATAAVATAAATAAAEEVEKVEVVMVVVKVAA